MKEKTRRYWKTRIEADRWQLVAEMVAERGLTLAEARDWVFDEIRPSEESLKRFFELEEAAIAASPHQKWSPGYRINRKYA